MSRRWLTMSAAAPAFIGLLACLAADARAEPERISAARRALEAAPESGRKNAADLRAVLLADEKDHGKPGNGLHDYPLWQKRWLALLGDRATAATGWPSEKQFAEAGVIVAYCYLDWNDERLAQMRRYLEGDLVLDKKSDE